MTNVDFKVTGDKLIITVDLTQDHGPSKSGKTIIIGTTHGFTSLDYKDDPVSISLNVTKKK